MPAKRKGSTATKRGKKSSAKMTSAAAPLARADAIVSSDQIIHPSPPLPPPALTLPASTAALALASSSNTAVTANDVTPKHSALAPAAIGGTASTASTPSLAAASSTPSHLASALAPSVASALALATPTKPIATVSHTAQLQQPSPQWTPVRAGSGSTATASSVTASGGSGQFMISSSFVGSSASSRQQAIENAYYSQSLARAGSNGGGAVTPRSSALAQSLAASRMSGLLLSPPASRPVPIAAGASPSVIAGRAVPRNAVAPPNRSKFLSRAAVVISNGSAVRSRSNTPTRPSSSSASAKPSALSVAIAEALAAAAAAAAGSKSATPTRATTIPVTARTTPRSSSQLNSAQRTFIAPPPVLSLAPATAVATSSSSASAEVSPTYSTGSPSEADIIASCAAVVGLQKEFRALPPALPHVSAAYTPAASGAVTSPTGNGVSVSSNSVSTRVVLTPPSLSSPVIVDPIITKLESLLAEAQLIYESGVPLRELELPLTNLIRDMRQRLTFEQNPTASALKETVRNAVSKAAADAAGFLAPNQLFASPQHANSKSKPAAAKTSTAPAPVAAAKAKSPSALIASAGAAKRKSDVSNAAVPTVVPQKSARRKIDPNAAVSNGGGVSGGAVVSLPAAESDPFAIAIKA